MTSRSHESRVQPELLTESELKAAYIQLLQEGYEMLSVDAEASPPKTIPELKAVKDSEIEMGLDQDLAVHYGVPKAYRISGALARVFYTSSQKRNRNLEFQGKFASSEPYDIYTRRLSPREPYKPEFDDAKWSELTRSQQYPVDSRTSQALPTWFSFVRKIILYRHGALTWSERKPHALDARNIWHSSREAHLQLDVTRGLETQTIIFCSQIARLPDGSYVPWKQSEEARLQAEGYTDYNYTGPYNPAVASRQLLPQHSPELVPPPLNGPVPPVGSIPLPSPPIFAIHPHLSSAQRAVSTPRYHHPFGGNLAPLHSDARSALPPLPGRPYIDDLTGKLVYPPVPSQHSFEPSVRAFTGSPSFPDTSGRLPPPPPPSEEWLHDGSTKRPRHRSPPNYQSPYKSLSHRQQAVYRQKKPLGDMAHRF
ncbi:hypothetical protein JCM3765_007508 [Sporobolomyces pararoseus]